MKLTNDQIRELTFGAVYSEEENGIVRFYKCTKKQIEAWGNIREVLGERAMQTSGIRMDLHTNSKTISFDSRSKVDVYINGLLRQSLNMGDGERATISICDPLGYPLDDARVTIIFSSHGNCYVTNVELDDGCYVTPHKYDTKILFIGDSITQGWNTSFNSKRYDSLSYAWRVSRFFNADCVIHGVGGGVFHKSVFDSIDFDPDTVIIAFGTNDFRMLETLAELKKNASEFMDLIAEEYNGKKIFLISPIWRAEQQMPMGSFKDCRETIIEESDRHGFIHIDGLTLVPPCPDFFSDETVHPNAVGFGIYAENLIKELLKYL